MGGRKAGKERGRNGESEGGSRDRGKEAGRNGKMAGAKKDTTVVR